ncbi:MAG: DegT/DnrJ/EryC1/StrS family aminotransferase [Betaproteobacteria bacterium]
MDLLIDVNVALDVCAQRKPHAATSMLAIEAAKAGAARLWLYAGSTQTLEYNLYQHLKRIHQPAPNGPSNKSLLGKARSVLSEFVKDKQWLAALAAEGPVFDAGDPEDEQLLRALDRFPAGSIKLLTRDSLLLEKHPDKTITPADYCRLGLKKQPLQFIDLKAQQDAIRPQLEQRIHRVIHHGQYIMGPEVKELEDKLAAYTGAKHCITVASGTEALLISLMALGIGPGDEVITTPFTFAATAEVIVLLGATPVYVDIEPDTCNINVALIEAKITPRTRAIMPVSLYGQVADMDEINAIAARHGNIPVIEDAAQSFGATYKGRKSCNLSTIGCTSFFPSKPLGCYGDGGAIFTNDDALATACREIRVHGQSARYTHTRVGVGGRMDTLQCAVVLAKLERFEWELQRRGAIGTRYAELLAGSRIELLTVRPDRDCVWAQFTVFVDERASVQAALQERGVPTAVHYPKPLHHQPAYAQHCCPGCCENCIRAAARVMSLPMSADLTAADQGRVVAALQAAVG